MESWHHLVFRRLCITLGLVVFSSVYAQSWRPLQGKLPRQLTGLYASKSTNYVLVTSLYSGIYRSVDEGASWANVLPTQDSLYTLQALDDQVLLAGSSGGVYRSVDSGKTWQRYSIGNRAKVGHLGMLPSGKILAGAGTMWDRSIKPAGVLLSSDTGRSWSAHNTGIGVDNALVEAMAVAPDGTAFIGIHDENTGLEGKYGLFKSIDEAKTWQRLPLDIALPFNVNYEDSKLRVGSVFNIAIIDQQIVAAIEGVYSNFGFAFTIKKRFSEINNAASRWNVHWVEDSLPSQGSYYEQTLNMYADSKGMHWSSVSGGGANNNLVYRGQLSGPNTWIQTNQGLKRGLGKYLFAENHNAKLFATNYYFGDSLFVFDLNDVHTDVSDVQSLDAEILVYPNPYTHTGLYLKSDGQETGSIDVEILDLSGHVVFAKQLQQSSASVYELLPAGYKLTQGFYVLQLKQGTKSLYHKLVAH